MKFIKKQILLSRFFTYGGLQNTRKVSIKNQNIFVFHIKLVYYLAGKKQAICDHDYKFWQFSPNLCIFQIKDENKCE